MKTRSILSYLLLASVTIAAGAFKIKTIYKNTDLYLKVNFETDQVFLGKQKGDDFQLSEESYLVLSDDHSSVIAHQENDIIQANALTTEYSFPLWKITSDNYLIYEVPLYACLHSSSYLVTVNPTLFANHEVDCFSVTNLMPVKEKRVPQNFLVENNAATKLHQLKSNHEILVESNKDKTGSFIHNIKLDNGAVFINNYEKKLHKELLKRDDPPVDPSKPMIIQGQIAETTGFFFITGEFVMIREGDALDAAKFTIDSGYLKVGSNYIDEYDGKLVANDDPLGPAQWTTIDNQIYFGAEPELVHFYGCEGKVSVDSSGGCEEITLIVIKNFNFEAQINTVDPTNAMLIQGQFDSQEVTISTSGDEVTVFTGDDVDAAKFTIVNRYLKAGDRYVAINGGSLVVVGDEGDAQRGWILSGDHLFFGEDPELVHFYGCEGKVSVDSSGGCEEITLIVIKNFEFVPVENTVDGSLPMAISGTLDEASVILSTDNDEVIVFGGDLVDATKFTLSGRYLKAGDRYVAIDGGALVVVETSGEATSGWILSGDMLYFGSDPKLVIFSVCDGSSVVFIDRLQCNVIVDIVIVQAPDWPISSDILESTVSEDSTESESIIDSSSKDEGVSTSDDSSIEVTTEESSSESTIDESTIDLTTEESSTEATTTAESDTEDTSAIVSSTSDASETDTIIVPSESLTIPEPTYPLVDPSKPIVITVTYEGEYARFLVDGIHISLLQGVLAIFQIDEGYLKVQGDLWIKIADDGLLELVDDRDIAAFGWSIEDSQLYYNVHQTMIKRDLDEPVGFSVCEEENGDLFVYVGEVYGCQVLENASLNNYGSADDPTSSISTDEESQVSSESSEVTDTISTLESSEYITSVVTSNESTTSDAPGSTSATSEIETETETSSNTTFPVSSESFEDESTTISDFTSASATTTSLIFSTIDTTSAVVIFTTTICDENGICSEIVITTTPGWKTASEWHCDSDGICDDETTSTIDEITTTTVTGWVTMTETSCVNSTICSTQTVVVSTVGTTNDPVTITNSLGDTATGTPKEASSKFWPGSFYTTITMTICSENDQCEEVVSVIPPNETMYISTSTKFEKEGANFRSGNTDFSTVTEQGFHMSSNRIENGAIVLKFSPMFVSLLALMNFLL